MIDRMNETMSDDEFARIARHGLEIFTESLLQEIAANPRRFASSNDTVKKLAEELLFMRDQRTLAEKQAVAAPTPHRERTETVEPLNFHAIVGPNGMCLCGVRADGTVVTCGAVLELEFQKRLAPTPETPSQPTDAPPDKAGRLMLNAYGRQCWDAGFEAGKLAGVVSPRT